MGLEEVVIVGAGQAGVQAAFSLRQKGFAGRLRLIGEEPGLPYQRPPLSKSFPCGGQERDDILLRTAAAFEKSAVDLLVDERAVAIERTERALVLASGARLPYDHLVIATGARNRTLPVPGGDHPDVLELRTLEHATRLREGLARASRVVVVGGGFVGLEVAATARALGLEVTVCEAQARLMPRSCTAALADHVLGAHRSAGIDVRLGACATRVVVEGGRVAGVELATGGVVGGDLVFVGIGIVPRVELAASAGLTVDDGVLVDDALRTADPHVSAIGDCAAFVCARAGRRLRLESVQNAVDQGKAVARAVVDGPAPYDAVPWFWSDQGPLKIQIAGLTGGRCDAVARQDPESGALSVFCFEGERLVGLETVGAPGDHILGRNALERGPAPRREEVADPGFAFKAWAKARRQKA